MELSRIPNRKYKEYDVFISFRGEDTRNNFTSYLHSKLRDAGVNAYIDDYLKKGDDVWTALSEKIEDSHAALVVFSKNYATSKWCLKELSKILECRKSEGQVVIPVFRNVDPSDIRNHKGAIWKKIFDKHRKSLLVDKAEDVNGTLSKWKQALTEAANLSGWDTRDKKEIEVIEKIVKDLLEKQKLRFPEDVKVADLVGFDEIRKEVEELVPKHSSKTVQILGLSGMCGVGKTVIAKSLFSQLFPKYDSVCFLEKVNKSELTSLRKKLISELLKDVPLNLTSLAIARRLGCKRVLVVLDDVDHSSQLDELCPLFRNVGQGSKLIITSTNRYLLECLSKEYNTHIYDIKLRSPEESLRLFCLKAFNDTVPKTGYEGLSDRFVEYAGRLPLALTILGSNLQNRDTEYWEDYLKSLKEYPEQDIQRVLQSSYDRLRDNVKEIFLDIAFFFEGEIKDFVKRILDACDLYPGSGLQDLQDTAFITVTNGKIQMHGLLQEMGLNIVRRKGSEKYKSRLRDVAEVSNAFRRNQHNRKVKGIKLDLSQIDELHLKATPFNEMTALRFLQLYVPPSKKFTGKMHYPKEDDLDQFSGKLSYLEWHEYALTSLPKDISTEMLAEIHMPHSHITKLWDGVKKLEKLERIDLSECKNLKDLPDLSTAGKLEWMKLSGCESLTELHPSVFSRNQLETLILDGCSGLTSLKSGDEDFKSLKKVSVNGCTSLKEFSMSLHAMERLDLNNVPIEELHLSIKESPSKLKWLNLEGLTQLWDIQIEVSQPSSLEELRVSNCWQLLLDQHKLRVLFDSSNSLTVLHLKDCNGLSELPDNLSVLSRLRELRLDGSAVKTLPPSIKLLSMLQILSLQKCAELEFLPELPAHVKELYAVNCTSLVTVSSLNHPAAEMVGQEIYISYENSMTLDDTSLHLVTDGAVLLAKSAVFQNALVNASSYTRHNFNFVRVCSPGSSVPKQFKNQTTRPSSSFSVDVPAGSTMRGLVFCAVLSPSDQLKEKGAKICCRCYNKDGAQLWYTSWWYHEAIRGLNGDHVFIWYDALHLDITTSSGDQKVDVKFYVKDYLGENHVPVIGTKACGALPVFDSDLPSFMCDLGMDFEAMWEFGSKLSSELEFQLGSVITLSK